MKEVDVIDYARPGPLTRLVDISAAMLAPVTGHPLEMCSPAHSLVIQPTDAQSIGLPAERFAENQIRPAAAILHALLAIDAAPLTVPREPEKRVIGTCRHFALLSCALLRYRGIPARVRCGFATYFQPNQALDHWITEYWDGERDRWVRVDSEILGQTVLSHPDELRPDDFLTGAEAWAAFRRGEIDDSQFGVYGTENWGAAEIRGNAVKDLAALPYRMSLGTARVRAEPGWVQHMHRRSPGHFVCGAPRPHRTSSADASSSPKTRPPRVENHVLRYGHRTVPDMSELYSDC